MGLYSSHRDEMFIELRLYSTTEAPERDVPCLGEYRAPLELEDGCEQGQAINISPLCGYGPQHVRLGFQQTK